MGTSFLVLSTGSLLETGRFAEPGTDFEPQGSQGDASVLHLRLMVPAAVNRLSFDYCFLSTESPEFVNSIYNDQLLVRVTDAAGTAELPPFASVNDSRFYPASQERARGTGYALFSNDPWQEVPSENIGDPDAGLTDFHTAYIPVNGGGEVHLEIEVRDVGDGIYDSAAIIDNLVYRFIETVDPRPQLLTKEGALKRNEPALLATQGRPVSSVAADGISWLLLRTEVSGPGRVNFAMTSDAFVPLDGGLVDLADLGNANKDPMATPNLRSAVQAAVQPVPDDGSPTPRYFAFAIYRGPDNFSRAAADYNKARREMGVAASFAPRNGIPTDTVTLTLQIVRPPVVLVHDLWSSTRDPHMFLGPGSERYRDCSDYRERAQATHFLTCSDLEETSYHGFAGTPGAEANVTVVTNSLTAALSEFRRRGNATSQVDVIGQGMGGILARMHIEKRSFKNVNNYFAGDINKLITINTPHFGSGMAKAIVDARLGNSTDPYIGRSSDKKRIPVNGAADQLVPGSASLLGLGKAPVPSHAVLGDLQELTNQITIDIEGCLLRPEGRSCVDSLSSLKAIKSSLFDLGLGYGQTAQRYYTNHLQDAETPRHLRLSYLAFVRDSIAFGEMDNNGFASLDSLRGGLADEATTTVKARYDSESDGWDTRPGHFHSWESGIFSPEIKSLLNQPAEGPLFADEFPAVRAEAATTSGLENQEAVQAGSAEATDEDDLAIGLQIVSPVSGTVVTSGDTVAVDVDPLDGFLPGVVLVDGGVSVIELAGPDYAGELQIPLDAVGTVELDAFSVTEDDKEIMSNTVELWAEVPAALTGVRIFNRSPVLIGIGTTQRLTVDGEFDDGIRRQIVLPAEHAVLRSAGPAVVSVSDEGKMVAVAAGIATVVFTVEAGFLGSGSAFQDSVTARVVDDADSDGVVGTVDNCPLVFNPQQTDTDNDGLGDACDPCPDDPTNDVDGDEVCGLSDNCIDVSNPGQEDADEDGIGDACDPCPNDPTNDVDGDGVCGLSDNCPAIFNPNQKDSDGDRLGNACDECPDDADNDQDADGVCGDVDNCPSAYNPPDPSNGEQADEDDDDIGDACDLCPQDPINDPDEDDWCGLVDNCPYQANSDQSDRDQDGDGDVCDECPDDADNDQDADGVCGDVDNCPSTYNPPDPSNGEQADEDDDDIGDACDLCPQDPINDPDEDDWCGLVDNCPYQANPDQSDRDGDGDGDVCDDWPDDPDNDVDNDGISGHVDNCPVLANPEQHDSDGDGLGDLCDKSMVAGDVHTCALAPTGKVWCWGNNRSGQVGNGSYESVFSSPQEVSPLGGMVVSLAAGSGHTCTQMVSGGVKCWGKNFFGQLGNGQRRFSQNRPVDVVLEQPSEAVSAGGQHTCAILGDGSVQCWGSNMAGQLGAGWIGIGQSMPVAVTGLAGAARAVAAGAYHTCALLHSGGVQCWGHGLYGQLGNGARSWMQPTPVDVSPLGSPAEAIAAGKYHTCALLETGQTKCWGSGAFGQLGDGNLDFVQASPVLVTGLDEGARAIACGRSHTCALLTAGGVKCWGAGVFGQLGDGQNQPIQAEPTPVAELCSGVFSLVAGGRHTCATTDWGEFKCWGANGYGQLGNGERCFSKNMPVDVVGL
jgi:alpha-tubulin suppressor-like RCC1 family protein